MSPTQFIVSGYLISIIIATILLLLPISLKDGVELSFIDALFTATSGISVTGLTVVNVSETFSVFGTIVLLVMFQIGGIGIMALGTFLWMILGRNISLSYRKLIMIDQNQNRLSGLVQLIRIVLGLVLLFEAIGTLIFTVYFHFAGYYDTWLESFYHGLFHSISSYTNAGFDIFGNSLFDFSHDYFVQIITIALIILGAIGFPVLIEMKEYFSKNNKNFRFSLYTKLTTSMFFLLLIIGAIGIWLVENQLYYADMSWHEKIFFSLFNSVTVRSGGLSTMDVSEFGVATQMFLSVLMFIGASPSSVGGGIRTTTFAIIILALITYALGKSEIRIFRRSLKEDDITKSFFIFTLASMTVVISTILLVSLEKDHFSLMAIIFEIASAFGTCGLSMGITSELTTVGKLIIMVLMFTGRIGVLSMLYIFQAKKKKENFHYPKEDIIIG
ncbi:TrkH family potassium uptake protein [Chengkuizengella axinellae]|uniref:TrkH family potassium uptake protein n=1 Tax=Chengkuizengella axinellae TaxID=3064388 RepID=A0ABT9J4M0_9BACL|nr:TrkH family potassium uptake protein [Chengkuizengella sp. 2205SS18-9]MDP5276580.1 TrkH family potassium uptake protein [Chengkuizengella sp. 2205SS18-9]